MVWKKLSLWIMNLTNTPLRRVSWIILLITIPVIVMYALKPKADYFPDGNRNLAFLKDRVCRYRRVPNLLLKA